MMGRAGWFALVTLALVMLSSPVSAAYETEFEDPVLRERYQGLLDELRCLVCQNQTIAESNAKLAEDLRERVREMLRKGKGDEAIIDYMVQRYGDFVRYRPPLKTSTVLLWTGPFLLLLIGGVTVWIAVRRRARGERGQGHLSADEREQARRLLGEDEQEGRT